MGLRMEKKVRTQLKEKYGVTEARSKCGVMYLGFNGLRTVTQLLATSTCPKCGDTLFIQVLFDVKRGEMVSEDYRCFTCNPRQEGE